MNFIITELRHGRNVAILVIKKQHVFKWNSSRLAKPTVIHTLCG